MAFQAGDGDAVHRADAQESGLPLTSYRHRIGDVTERLECSGFDVHGFAQRAPELAHESSPQAFVIARRR
jgi:hypothetical protein